MNNAKNIFRPGSIIGAITVIIAGYAMSDTVNKFFDTVKNMNDDFSLGVYGILNMPFLLINVLALVFALIGLIGYKRWGMLTAGILYSVSGIIWFTWLFYAMPQGILAFVAFSRMVSPGKAQQQKNYRSEPEREIAIKPVKPPKSRWLVLLESIGLTILVLVVAIGISNFFDNSNAAKRSITVSEKKSVPAIATVYVSDIVNPLKVDGFIFSESKRFDDEQFERLGEKENASCHIFSNRAMQITSATFNTPFAESQNGFLEKSALIFSTTETAPQITAFILNHLSKKIDGQITLDSIVFEIYPHEERSGGMLRINHKDYNDWCMSQAFD